MIFEYTHTENFDGGLYMRPMFDRNELVKILLAHRADKSLVDARGLSVVDLAMQKGNIEAVRCLKYKCVEEVKRTF